MMNQQLLAKAIESLKPCPFCQQQPTVDHLGLMPNAMLGVRCLNHQCKIKPQTGTYEHLTAFLIWNDREAKCP